jgi:excisionase family DNA binding protein
LKLCLIRLDNANVGNPHEPTSSDANVPAGDSSPPRDDASVPAGQGGHDGNETAPTMSDDRTASQTELAHKRIFTTGEAAAICKISQQTIIRCFDNGRLTGFKVPGSKFRRIPREELVRFMKANNIPLSNLPGAEGAEGTPKLRILAVDDDNAMLDMYRDIIADDPRVELHTASTGYDAGLMTIELRPQLILLDFMLPDINGNLVCKRVRERPELASTKVLIVSGVVQQSQIDELMRAGADGVLRKPFEVRQLAQTIRQLLADNAVLAHRL